MQKQEFKNATLYLADCADILPQLVADTPPDALISDPPYVLYAVGGGIGRQRQYMGAIDGHLDGGFDTAMLAAFENWFVFCGKNQLVSLFAQAERQGLRYQLLTWNKRNPTPLTNGNYLPDTEYMVHAFKKHIWANKTRFIVGNVEKNPFDHPTVKPQYVMAKALTSASAEGDLVLDPFMGTGSTGVAALRLGRRFIGIEKEPKYFDIACQRIENALAQGRLF